MYYPVTTKYVCGIDLHAKTLTACVMDRDGKIMKKRTLDCQVLPVIEFLHPWGKDITVGVESTYNWYWLIDALNKYKIPNSLGHALYIKRKMSLKHKTDPVDSRGIGDLLRSNQFPITYSYPPKMRAIRDLLRRRHFFVRHRAGTFTHFQNTLHQDGYIEPLRNKLQYKSSRDSLVNLTHNDDMRKILLTDLEYIKSLDCIIEDLDKTINKKAQHHNFKDYQTLQTMPGCGVILALTILYETHTIHRFRTPQCYSSYSRVVRAENESAGKNLGGSSNDKIGNPYLKWAISEIGQSMIRNYPEICIWYRNLADIYGPVKAHARMRHKIAVAIFYMLKHDRVFDLERFLGTRTPINQAENPAHNWSETSGHISEPICLIENPPGILKTRSKSKTRKDTKITGRLSLRTTGKRKVLTKSASNFG
jgi:transposase